MEEKDKDKPETTPSQSATVTIKNNTRQLEGRLIAAKPNPHSSTSNSPTAPKTTRKQTLDDFSLNSDSDDNDSSSEGPNPELEERLAGLLQGKLPETQTKSSHESDGDSSEELDTVQIRSLQEIMRDKFSVEVVSAAGTSQKFGSFFPESDAAEPGFPNLNELNDAIPTPSSAITGYYIDIIDRELLDRACEFACKINLDEIISACKQEAGGACVIVLGAIPNEDFIAEVQLKTTKYVLYIRENGKIKWSKDFSSLDAVYQALNKEGIQPPYRQINTIQYTSSGALRWKEAELEAEIKKTSNSCIVSHSIEPVQVHQSQDSRLKKFRYQGYDPHFSWKSPKSESQDQSLKTPKAPVPIKNPRLSKVTHQTSDGQFFETIIDTTEAPQITLRKKPKNEGLKSIIEVQLLRSWRPVPILLALFTLAASIALYTIGGMGSGVAYDGLVFLFKFLPWNPVISILVVATFFAALSAFAIYNSLGTQRVITMTEDNLPSSAPVGVPKGKLDGKGGLAPTSNPTHAPPVFKAIPSVIGGVGPNLITTEQITQDL